jgi:mannose-6-phosphate isomerase-like protein (cupin superfamily)
LAARKAAPTTLHKGADQWLNVVDGSGVAIINGHRTQLKAGTIVLIEAGDRHEIRNPGRTLLKAVGVYVPPANRDEGNELLAGRGE